MSERRFGKKETGEKKNELPGKGGKIRKSRKNKRKRW